MNAPAPSAKKRPATEEIHPAGAEEVAEKLGLHLGITN
jgi:hypothetical protein